MTSVATMGVEAARALHESVLGELSRRDLLAFGARVQRGFQAPAHIQLIAGLLERVERGELRRLIVNVPPRHGKSLLCSSIFPAWYLGRHPDRNVIIGTHSSELSEKNSRAARAIVEDDRWPFAARLSPDSTAVYRWNMVEGGGLYAIGSEGSITGRGADLLVLDDLQHDGGTEGERASIMQWFTEVAVPRLEPNAAIVCIGTRFNDDDVFAKILEGAGGSAWEVVRLPAIAEDSDPLGRAPGAALWPARMPLAELRDRREQMGTRAFAAQFQQDPSPTGGDLVKFEWLSNTYKRVPEDARRLVALDAATKTGLGNDWSVALVLAVSGKEYFVVDVIRRKVEYPDLRRMVEQVHERYEPSHWYIEDAANGSPLIQSLKSETRLPIVAVVPKGSKIARLEAVSGTLEAQRVRLPEEAPWLDAFVRELLAFPGGKHDDQVDALVLALSEAARSGSNVSWGKLSMAYRDSGISVKRG